MSLVGRRLGAFELLAELGSGSMATVYKARAPDGGFVAVKLFHGFLSKNDRLLQRFRRESRVIASLVHPNIIPFRGYFEHGANVFYAMEYLEHRTVEELQEDGGGSIPIPLGVRILRDLCAGLAYAHGKDIIHRDLKPSNLFYAQNSGSTILSDFGLAKSLNEAPITQAGSKMMGTPHYMAPEQVVGEETSARTDIYQAGLVLFQLLTGHLAFVAPNPFQAVVMRCERDPAFEQAEQARIPAELRAIVARACARQPEERYLTAQEMGRELEALI